MHVQAVCFPLAFIVEAGGGGGYPSAAAAAAVGYNVNPEFRLKMALR